MDLEELELRKRELQLQRQIAWMEREQSGLRLVKTTWRWMLTVGVPLGLAFIGAALATNGLFERYDRSVYFAVGAGCILAALGVRWFARRSLT